MDDTTGTQALWPQMISALAAIDRELDLPDDGCNSLAQTLAAIREMKEAAKEAAEHLRNEATELKRAHTASNEWDGTEPEAMTECERLIALADRLQANALSSAAAVGGRLRRIVRAYGFC